MIIMGIDPGETTGWAVCQLGGGKSMQVRDAGEINCEDLLTSGFDLDEPGTKYARYRAVALALMQIAEAEKVSVVIIEDFTLRQMTTTKPEGISPVRIGAMLEVWLHEIVGIERKIKVEWQTAANAKSVVTDQRLKDLDLWVRGFPHARDAIRHCELYRRKMTSM